LELDQIAESVIRDGGGTPSFLGYHGFPASICASVNDRVVHGIPSAGEKLAAGDLVSIADFVAAERASSAAMSVPIPNVTAESPCQPSTIAPQ
ncbi:M24 family metallopeptidase, partial [Mycobacterium kansasii]